MKLPLKYRIIKEGNVFKIQFLKKWCKIFPYWETHCSEQPGDCGEYMMIENTYHSEKEAKESLVKYWENLTNYLKSIKEINEGPKIVQFGTMNEKELTTKSGPDRKEAGGGAMIL